jgi:formylglycine-generating enzyme required for sulfatase activity
LTAPIAKDGAFEFAQVLPGAYTLTVTPSNVVGNVSRTITVDSQAVAGIEILPPSAKDKVGEFVRIQPGEFNMGCLPEDGCDQVPLLGRGGFGPVALRNLKPPSQQRIEKAFELGKFEVTQAQWEQVMGKNPVAAPQPAARGARGGTTASIGPDHPVERVRWDEAHKFIDKLNKLNDGYRYRLPTAAEWEYAARAGGVAKTENSRINLSDLLLPGPVNAAGPANAWHAGNSGGASHRVGQLPANAWGLHDMLGNVAEWVEQSTERQTQKLTRGGSFSHPPELVSPATETPQHTNGSPLVGFRLAREPIVKSSSTRSKK